jgi:hypothetical protein
MTVHRLDARSVQIECDLCHGLTEPYVARLGQGPEGWVKPTRHLGASRLWGFQPDDLCPSCASKWESGA